MKSYFYVEYNGQKYLNGGTATVPPFEATGGTDSFTVHSSRAWEIGNKPNWITLGKTEGKRGSTLVGLTAATNATSDQRTGELHVGLKCFLDRRNINVDLSQQAIGSAYITVNFINDPVNADVTTNAFTVTYSEINPSTLGFYTPESDGILSCDITNKTVTFAANDGYEDRTITLAISGLSTVGQFVSGSAHFTQSKKVVTPSLTIVYTGSNISAAGSDTDAFTLTKNYVTAITRYAITPSTASIVSTGQTGLTVRIPANQTNSQKTYTVSVTGTDVYNAEQTASTTVTQVADSYTFRLNPTAYTAASTDVQYAYTIVSTNVSNIGVSNYTGAITGATINGTQLIVNFNQNQSSDPKSGTVTITGKTVGGRTVTATGNLTQNAAGAVTLSIVYNGNDVTPAAGNTNDFTITAVNVTVTGYSANNGATVSNTGLTTVTLNYPANQDENNPVVYTVTVRGLDAFGNDVTASCEVEQIADTYSFSVTPDAQRVNWDATTAVFTTSQTNVTNVGYYSTASENINSVSKNGNVYTATISPNSTSDEKTIKFVASGNTRGGKVVYATGTTIQNGKPDAGTISVTPDGTQIGSGATSVTFYVRWTGLSADSQVSLSVSNAITSFTPNQVNVGNNTTSGVNITANISANPDTSPRNATLTASGIDNLSTTRSDTGYYRQAAKESTEAVISFGSLTLEAYDNFSIYSLSNSKLSAFTVFDDSNGSISSNSLTIGTIPAHDSYSQCPVNVGWQSNSITTTRGESLHGRLYFYFGDGGNEVTTSAFLTVGEELTVITGVYNQTLSVNGYRVFDFDLGTVATTGSVAYGNIEINVGVEGGSGGITVVCEDKLIANTGGTSEFTVTWHDMAENGTITIYCTGQSGANLIRHTMDPQTFTGANGTGKVYAELGENAGAGGTFTVSATGYDFNNVLTGDDDYGEQNGGYVPYQSNIEWDESSLIIPAYRAGNYEGDDPLSAATFHYTDIDGGIGAEVIAGANLVINSTTPGPTGTSTGICSMYASVQNKTLSRVTLGTVRVSGHGLDNATRYDDLTVYQAPGVTPILTIAESAHGIYEASSAANSYDFTVEMAYIDTGSSSFGWYYSASTTGNITSVSLNRSTGHLLVTLAENNTPDDIIGVVCVSSVTVYGDTIWASIAVRQEGYNPPVVTTSITWVYGVHFFGTHEPREVITFQLKHGSTTYATVTLDTDDYPYGSNTTVGDYFSASTTVTLPSNVVTQLEVTDNKNYYWSYYEYSGTDPFKSTLYVPGQTGVTFNIIAQAYRGIGGGAAFPVKFTVQNLNPEQIQYGPTSALNSTVLSVGPAEENAIRGTASYTASTFIQGFTSRMGCWLEIVVDTAVTGSFTDLMVWNEDIVNFPVDQKSSTTYWVFLGNTQLNVDNKTLYVKFIDAEGYTFTVSSSAPKLSITNKTSSAATVGGYQIFAQNFQEGGVNHTQFTTGVTCPANSSVVVDMFRTRETTYNAFGVWVNWNVAGVPSNTPIYSRIQNLVFPQSGADGRQALTSNKTVAGSSGEITLIIGEQAP